MAEETHINIDDNSNSDSSDLLRKIVAAVVGVIVIIAIVLLAKWAGDAIRDRFLTKSTTTTTTQTATTDNTTNTINSANTNSKNTNVKVSTFSAIPSTGPSDMSYALFAFLAISGLSTLALSKKFIS